MSCYYLFPRHVGWKSWWYERRSFPTKHYIRVAGFTVWWKGGLR